MKRRGVKRLVSVTNWVVSFFLAIVAVLDVMQGNYWMALGDLAILICFIVLLWIAYVFYEERNPDDSPPTQQVDMDKDDAA